MENSGDFILKAIGLYPSTISYIDNFIDKFDVDYSNDDVTELLNEICGSNIDPISFGNYFINFLHQCAIDNLIKDLSENTEIEYSQISDVIDQKVSTEVNDMASYISFDNKCCYSYEELYNSAYEYINEHFNK